MKTIQIALLVTMIAGCASTPGKIQGNYGVFFDPAFAPDEQIVRALRDRLSSVDVVASPADDAYDAVIVLSRDASGPFLLQPQVQTTATVSRPRVLQRMELVHFEIMRDGKLSAAGDVRVIGGYPEQDLVERRQQLRTDDRDSARRQQAYGRGVDVARSVAEALKGAG
jgi:hypothetical protein